MDIENDNLKKFTNEQINSIMDWFNSNPNDKENTITSEKLQNMLSNIYINTEGEYLYLNGEIEEDLSKLLYNWEHSNNKLSTLDRIEFLRYKFDIPVKNTVEEDKESISDSLSTLKNTMLKNSQRRKEIEDNRHKQNLIRELEYKDELDKNADEINRLKNEIKLITDSYESSKKKINKSFLNDTDYESENNISLDNKNSINDIKNEDNIINTKNDINNLENTTNSINDTNNTDTDNKDNIVDTKNDINNLENKTNSINYTIDDINKDDKESSLDNKRWDRINELEKMIDELSSNKSSDSKQSNVNEFKTESISDKLDNIENKLDDYELRKEDTKMPSLQESYDKISYYENKIKQLSDIKKDLDRANNLVEKSYDPSLQNKYSNYFDNKQYSNKLEYNQPYYTIFPKPLNPYQSDYELNYKKPIIPYADPYKTRFTNAPKPLLPNKYTNYHEDINNPSSLNNSTEEYYLDRLKRIKDLRLKLESENKYKSTRSTPKDDIGSMKGIFNYLKNYSENIGRYRDTKPEKHSNENDNEDSLNLSKIKKQMEDNYTTEEFNYYLKMSEEEKEFYLLLEKTIKEHNQSDIPLRFKVLKKKINLDNKAIIIKKIDEHNKSRLNLGGENNKFNNWLTGLLKIPFGVYKSLPITKENSNDDICDYLLKAKDILDKAVYGHKTTKNQIIQLLAQWISNPTSGGNVIGIQGPMGNGKTTLVKDGISKAVDRPFAFITLGGCSDSSFLEGHSYTYEGSMWGRVADVLIQSKCMNPIFYFDELDKISKTTKGDEIINMLIHMTDGSQNSQFQDKYFSGIDIDLSKSIFIFSYNDPEKISPILLDRLLTINTDGFEKDDKLIISRKYLIPKILSLLGMDDTLVEISDDVISYLIENFTDELGVRSLKKNLEIIYSKLNVIILTKGKKIFSYDSINCDELPVKITTSIIDTLLDEFKEKEEKKNESFMYI